MAVKSLRDIWGREYDWLAIDADGRVVFFSTAGGGYAPAAFLEDTDAHAAAISVILAMPISTAAEFAPILSTAYVNTWQAVAERGLYAFDSDANGSPYKLVAAPVKPATVRDLPAYVAAIVRRNRLSRLSCAGMLEETEIEDAFLKAANHD